MGLNYERMMAWTVETRHRFTERDTMLYALGVGLAADPVDSVDLPFVYEKDLRPLATFPFVLGYSSSWLKDTEQFQELDWRRIVHGEQSIVHHAPIPVAGEVVSHLRVTDVIDKGPGKGALIYTERTISDAASGHPLATLGNTTFCRGDGGFGGPQGSARPIHAIPDRNPDLSVDFATSRRAALIYRLSGDYNALHADPEVARAGGFDRPILHGMCTLGAAAWSVVKAVSGGDPEAVTAISARFSGPVVPGDRLRTDVWVDGDQVSFQTWVMERNALVLANGRLSLGSQPDKL